MTVIDGGLELQTGDLSAARLEDARAAGRVAWDIETSGLSFRADEIETCQVALGHDIVVVRLERGVVPQNLRELLGDDAVLKVFHHAPFDLRFMAHKWGVRPHSVACTKIAAKILWPGRDSSEYSLKPLLEEMLDVSIDKGQQVSDWSRAVLTSEQLAYAANDVRFLTRLYDELMTRATACGLADAVEASYAYLPTRVQLDIAGAGDVFAY